MKENFNRCLNFVLVHEGGYTNDPSDPGGETNLGINKRDHPKENIKGMTRERAAEIYRSDYWDIIDGDTLPWPFDLLAFDSAVLYGPVKAREWIKSANQTVPPNVNAFLAARCLRTFSIAQANPKLRKFVRGWLNRIADLFLEAVKTA